MVPPPFSFKYLSSLKQGFPLSPFIFLLVAKSLSRMTLTANQEGTIKGVQTGEAIILTLLLLVHDNLLFSDGTIREWGTYKRILDAFCLAMEIDVNVNISMPLCKNISLEVEAQIGF